MLKQLESKTMNESVLYVIIGLLGVLYGIFGFVTNRNTILNSIIVILGFFVVNLAIFDLL